MSENPISPIVVDPQSKMTLELARKAAKSSATLLLNGETGVGKELIAHFIHENSPFNQGPFISINCAALPDNMIEAILFGYEKGAFTSAINSYVGKFEQAEGGTLLLDEISEIPLSLQAKLLRVLQEREIERLGGKAPIQVKVRIIAATNRDLYEEVLSGNFRSDLFYRLNVIPIYCAPLRERTLDIIPLAEYFIEKHAILLNRRIPTLSTSAKQKLMHYPWPGNVREMENVIQRLLVMNSDEVILADQISMGDKRSSAALQRENKEDLALFDSKIKNNEARMIIETLEETSGSRCDTAEKLRISPRTLRYKISKLKSIGVKIP